MIGKTLSQRYEVQAELGRGGMGVVYRARDTLLSRDVAVKLIPPTLLSPESEERFRREAQLVAQMDHPSIAPIYDLGHHEGSLFLVMPLLQGRTLRSFLREGSPSLGDVIDAGIELAEALDYSHARGVVHRDVKPENVMVAREESGRVRVRVMDFGLARAAGEGRITTTGAPVGTLASEQVAKREVDSRCDVYSLGTVLYESVVGAPPFSGEVESLLYRIVHEVPQPPRALGAVIDEEMESLILACLAKGPARRPQRAAEVAEALRRYRWRLRDKDLGRPVFTRTAPLERPSLAPFIGRGREFAELQQGLGAALSGECQFVVLAGEPGIGKTRLADELEKLAKARGIRVLRGRSVEQDRSFPSGLLRADPGLLPPEGDGELRRPGPLGSRIWSRFSRRSARSRTSARRPGGCRASRDDRRGRTGHTCSSCWRGRWPASGRASPWSSSSRTSTARRCPSRRSSTSSAAWVRRRR